MAACTALALAPFLLAGCEHPVPYQPQPVPPNDTLTGSPRRLTFNPEGDWWPTFLPDGSAIGYSYHPLERSDHDRCIAFIPPRGGRIFRQICAKGPHEKDSSNVASSFAVSPGGRVALVAESGNPRIAFPEFRALYVGSLTRDSLVRVRDFPYTTPEGHLHYGAMNLVWPNESTLVYVAMYYGYRPAIVDIPPDTEYTGIELVLARFHGDTLASLGVVPNTSGASSLAPGAGDTVYFTMGGDSRVFSLAVQSGQVQTFYDFGALGIARDVQVRGGTLAAVVGGRVNYYFRPTWGIPAQADSGGPLYIVHLPAGPPVQIVSIAPFPLPGSTTYRHLALDPSGHFLVTEQSRLVVRVLREFTDTVVAKESDLWLFDVP